MLAIITKVSSDHWYRFKDIDNVEELLRFKYPVIVGPNHYTKDMVKFWDGFKKKDIPLLEQAKIHVKIYDDYIE